MRLVDEESYITDKDGRYVPEVILALTVPEARTLLDEFTGVGIDNRFHQRLRRLLRDGLRNRGSA